jgi:hypothetical protein
MGCGRGPKALAPGGIPSTRFLALALPAVSIVKDSGATKTGTGGDDDFRRFESVELSTGRRGTEMGFGAAVVPSTAPFETSSASFTQDSDTRRGDISFEVGGGGGRESLFGDGSFGAEKRGVGGNGDDESGSYESEVRVTASDYHRGQVEKWQSMLGAVESTLRLFLGVCHRWAALKTLFLGEQRTRIG